LQDSEEGGDKCGGVGKPYLCPYCSASFPHQSKLTRHILSHSLDSLKYRESSSSSFLFPPLNAAAAALEPPPLSAFDSQLQQGYRPGAKPEQQQSAFHSAAENLSFKMDYASPPTRSAVDAAPEGGAVVCKFCGQAFPDVSALVAHLPAHTGDRPFKCSFCGKAFKLRHHMKDHCRVHTGERPFRCSLCGKTFSRSTILKAHEKTHYPKYMRKFLSPSPGIEGPPPPEQQRLSPPTQSASRPPS
jgi:uncharacterized Zn-finger protein